MISIERLSDFQDKDKIERQLISAGMHISAVKQKVDLFDQSAERLQKAGINNNTVASGFFVPGRIEVLGKHTDYAGGSSIVAAVDRGFCLICTQRDDREVHIFNVQDDENVVLELSADLNTKNGHWSHYPATVIKRVVRNFGNGLKGCNIAFASDLPVAAGMSSSSAMVISMFMALARCNDIFNTDKYKNNIKDTIDLSQYLASIENGRTFNGLTGSIGVGTFGGSEDHTAILNCQSDYISRFSYCPIKFHKKLKIPDEYVFVIASSGVDAEKTGTAMGKYNRASNLVQKISELWTEKTGYDDASLFDAVNRSEDSVKTIKKIINNYENNKYDAKDLTDRFDQFYIENFKIIPKAAKSLDQDNFDEFGKLVDRSQSLTTYKLKNQVPETEYLAREARRLGAIAASAFGAGFGGSVWTLIEKQKAGEFIEKYKKNYGILYPEASQSSEFFIANPGPSAFDLQDAK
ncbi:MAG TPA: galactokinase family protein [bacterium]|nr:galactokinase family protein [bacterium]